MASLTSVLRWSQLSTKKNSKLYGFQQNFVQMFLKIYRNFFIQKS